MCVLENCYVTYGIDIGYQYSCGQQHQALGTNMISV